MNKENKPQKELIRAALVRITGDDSIYDDYNEVLASGVIESSKKPIDISRMV